MSIEGVGGSSETFELPTEEEKTDHRCRDLFLGVGFCAVAGFAFLRKRKITPLQEFSETEIAPPPPVIAPVSEPRMTVPPVPPLQAEPPPTPLASERPPVVPSTPHPTLPPTPMSSAKPPAVPPTPKPTLPLTPRLTVSEEQKKAVQEMIEILSEKNVVIHAARLYELEKITTQLHPFQFWTVILTVPDLKSKAQKILKRTSILISVANRFVEGSAKELAKNKGRLVGAPLDSFVLTTGLSKETILSYINRGKKEDWENLVREYLLQYQRDA